MVLSLENGLLVYRKNKGRGTALAIPYAADSIHFNYFMPPGESDLPDSVRAFLVYLSQAINMTTLLNLDMAHYLAKNYVQKVI